MTAAQVARHLGRSRFAVEDRRHLLIISEGLAFDGAKNPHWIGARTLLAKTCPGCGLLLDSSWYKYGYTDHHRRKQWSPRCNRCTGEQYSPAGAQRRRESQKIRQRDTRAARSSEAKLQALSEPNAHRHKEPWIEADHAVLRDPDLLVIEKAIRLGRTYKATMGACHRFGYKSKVGRGDATKGAWVIDNPNLERILADASA